MVAPIVWGIFWGVTKAATAYAAYRTADELAFDGKVSDAIGKGGEALVTTGWNMVTGDETTQPQTELAQEFSTQTGGNSDISGTTQQRLESSTSNNLSLTETQREAAAPEEEQPGNGLFGILGNLMGNHSGKIGIGAGLTSLFGLSKLGVGGGKATFLGALLAIAVTYQKEIRGFAKDAFDSVKDMIGPTNQQSYSNGFVSYNSEGKVFDPKTATSGNSFADLRPL